MTSESLCFGDNIDSRKNNGEAVKNIPDSEQENVEAKMSSSVQDSEAPTAELRHHHDPADAPDEEFHRSGKLSDAQMKEETLNANEAHKAEEIEQDGTEKSQIDEAFSLIEIPSEIQCAVDQSLQCAQDGFPEAHEVVEALSGAVGVGETDRIAVLMGDDEAPERCTVSAADKVVATDIITDTSDNFAATDTIDASMNEVDATDRIVAPPNEDYAADIIAASSTEQVQTEVLPGAHPACEEAKHVEESDTPSQPETQPEVDLEETSNTKNYPEEELQLSELESIQIPSHWHPKPCVHVSTVGGGSMTEEELLPLFGKYGPISSVSFENERHDAAVIRYELHLEDAEELLHEVRQALNDTKLEDRTITVEPFRPDSLLFVGNLTSNIDDTSLQEMFSSHGKIERAFVLRNSEGKSKCYGFVEYSLKSQAVSAKTAMGNTNMGGRVLRVEWSDCKKVADMFSSVLFVDRLPREGPHIETTLRELFGNYGKIRDFHLAIGIGNQYRGFAFIDFNNSLGADKAHQALDGYNFEGSSIRVSFANPSKSAQSYKFRYGSQAGQSHGGRGAPTGHGMVMCPSVRGPPSVPLMPPRYMSPGRPGMLGYGVGMQFGRGHFDRGTMPPFHNGVGMPHLGPAGRASLMFNAVASRPGMPLGDNSRLPYGQGPMSITPSAIVQVATAQAKAREEEAKARAEAAKHAPSRSSVDQYQRYQPQHTSYEQHYRQPDPSHGYFQGYQHPMHQQASFQQHPQAWDQQSAQQMPQNPRVQYNGQRQATQNYPQQQQAEQSANYSQNNGFYHQHSQQMQHGYSAHYGQQQAYQYGQHAPQSYGQVAQQTGQQYQQAAQVPQQNYSEHYVQQQPTQQQNYPAAVQSTPSSGVSSAQDAAQQQAYSAYYQQQAQVAANPTVTSGLTQQSYEAQWAAYYASQAAYQQQTSSTEVGQKRTADQMEQYTQNQASYNYAGYCQDGTAYQQQQGTTAYQQTATPATAVYQQQGTGNQQSGAAYIAQPSIGHSGYEQPALAAADGYQQPVTVTDGAGAQSQGGAYDYNKRPRY